MAAHPRDGSFPGLIKLAAFLKHGRRYGEALAPLAGPSTAKVVDKSPNPRLQAREGGRFTRVPSHGTAEGEAIKRAEGLPPGARGGSHISLQGLFFGKGGLPPPHQLNVDGTVPPSTKPELLLAVLVGGAITPRIRRVGAKTAARPQAALRLRGGAHRRGPKNGVTGKPVSPAPKLEKEPGLTTGGSGLRLAVWLGP